MTTTTYIELQNGKPAARVGDTHTCPMSSGAVKHVGGPILGLGAPDVLIEGRAAARMGDLALCVGGPDTIAKGAFPVPICGNPAARKTDKTAHGGVIAEGCSTVLIGLAGIGGNIWAGKAMCQAAAAGRTSKTAKQSYDNCGVESSRQIINQVNKNDPTKSSLTEDQLLQTALDNNWAGRGHAPNAPQPPPVPPGTPPTLWDGRTNPASRQAILANSGVASTVQASNLNNLGLATSRGQGVIASLDAHYLWMNPDGTSPVKAGSKHAVTVTGVEYDDNGNATNVIINDTGVGQCGQRVPVNTWNAAVNGYNNPRLNVTNDPIY